MSVNEIISLGIYGGAFLVLFGLGELLFHLAKFPVEITRKVVHLGTGLICLTFPSFLGSHWSVLILTIAFFLLLIFSMKWGVLKSINSVNRKTAGSFLFPLSIYVTYWAFSLIGLSDFDGNDLLSHQVNGSSWYNGAVIYYYLPILILSVSDPAAALVGKKWRLGKYKIMGTTKTLIGSLGFLVSSFIISASFIYNLDINRSSILLVAFVIAISTTIVEAISQKGLDNLLIPLTTIVVLFLFRNTILG